MKPLLTALTISCAVAALTIGIAGLPRTTEPPHYAGRYAVEYRGDSILYVAAPGSTFVQCWAGPEPGANWQQISSTQWSDNQ